jgi:phenylacetate-CoA ligase
MNLFIKSLELKGFPIRQAVRDLQYIQSLDSADFQNWVLKKREQQVKYLIANNRFYREVILKNQPYKSFESLPIIKKSDIQRPLKEILSDNIQNKDIFTNNTSGSSGTPFFFAKDKYAHSMTWALVMDRYKWHEIEYGKSLQARFYGIPLSGAKYYKEKIKDSLSARVRFPVFDLSQSKLDAFIENFKRYKFEYLNGYTSSLVFFAQYCIERNIVLKEICPTLKVCFPTSEMCSQNDRYIMQKGFGVHVANEYGCAEMDVLAFENSAGEWLMSNENVYFEVVDDWGNLLSNGQKGRLLLTSLYNNAIPMIRYEVGDIGTIHTVRKGNLQQLHSLAGRTNEFAILPDGRKVPALTFYYITKTLINEQYGIKELIIRQKSADLFHFEYVARQDMPAEAVSEIKRAMDQYLATGLRATFERKESIQRTAAGKLRQFYCEI